MRRGIISLAAAVVLFCLPAGGGDLAAQERKLPEGPFDIEADRITYDAEADTVHAEGKVLITFAEGFLKADAVSLNRRTSRAIAEGEVLVRSDQDVLEGQKVEFDMVAKRGTVSDGKMFIAQNHFTIKAGRIEKTGDVTYRLEDVMVTACDGLTPDWSLSGSALDLTVDGYGVLKNGRFLVRDVPIFYTPYFLFPAKTTRQSGFLFPRFFFSRDKNGLDVELPFYWAINDHADATFFQRTMEKRGFKEGAELRYFIGTDSVGTLYGDFLNDRKHVTETVGETSRDWQEDRRRWSYYLNHETTFASGLTLRSDIRRVSDPWYFRDFASFNYYQDHYAPLGEDPFRRVPFLANESLGSLDSTVRLAKDWSLVNLTALVRYTDDFSTANNDATLQKYPEVTLTGFRRPLAGDLLQFDFTGGYSHLYRGEGQKGHLWEISPIVYLPLNLGPHVQLTPLAGFQGDLWDRSDSREDSGDKHGNRKIFRFGAALSTEIQKVYDLDGRTAEKIRHGIKPEIEYTFIPNTTQDGIPDFLERIPEEQALTYGLTQTLLARIREGDGKITYLEMMRFKLSQTYDIRESRREGNGPGKENRPLGDVALELDLAPNRFLFLAARNIYNVNSNEWKQSNYDLILSDRRGDSFSAGYRYTRDLLEEVNLSLKAALTSSLDMVYVLRRNQLDRQTIEATYGVKYRQQCWDVEFSWSDRKDDRTLMVNISLSGLGTGVAR